MKEYRIHNRITGVDEIELSGNAGGLNFLYNSLPGKVITRLFTRHFVSGLYGIYVKSKSSKRLINGFIRQYNINQSEIKLPPDSFKSLNDFFIRELKDSVRAIDPDPSHLISPADSRLFIFDLANHDAIPIKGYWHSLVEFVKDHALAEEFSNGWCFVYRLAPCDYHRFCYIDSGKQDTVRRIKGILHSVNPVALSSVKSLLAKNYRELTILHTESFGKALHFEVGALMVGKVILHNRQATSFTKGEEKGWFEFGGSTIVQIFKREAVIPDADILINTGKGVETFVKKGERVGSA